ncbi:MAG: hypothetical protein ACF8GE_06765 [Phycisphaerales bacterium JB043]
MRTRLLHTTLLALVSGIVLASCDGSSEPEAQTSSTAPPPPVLGGDTTPVDNGPTHTLDFEDEPVDPTLRDATPHEAFATFLQRLQANDIFGAVEVCDPDDPNTLSLRRIAEGAQRAAEDSQGMDVLGLLLAGIEDVTFELTEENEDTAVVQVTAPRQKTYNLVRTEDGWRIRLPRSGHLPHQ